ncbi:MAG: HNH endonuclease signature motif containing protein [Deltaproteobacteria bacterium]|nr:HNH endonuclease signature motif containing protein [Deltaproteobacteria bacterium]
MRGYDSRWANYRASYLRQHPLCVRCQRPATMVDHIIPVTGPDDPLFWPETNHQSLCRDDHAAKTAEDRSRQRIDDVSIR